MALVTEEHRSYQLDFQSQNYLGTYTGRPS